VTALPVIGQEPWGDQLNEYLALLEAKILTNTTLITTLQAQVTRLSKQLTVIGRWQTNTQVGATPGGMQVTSDTGNFRQATWLRFAKLDQSNTEMTEMLSKASYLVVQHQNDSTMWVHETITGPALVDPAYVQVPVRCDAYGKVGVAWQNVVVTMIVNLE
jgi:hypothetical protein